MDKIEELLTRGVANIISSKKALKKLLESGRKLNIYFGIDPTTTKIHLGHAVLLRKLQKFAEADHNVIFLIGDFTALIGDTSDKDAERPILTSTQIEDNFKTYKKQAEKILDFSKIQVKYNSEWLKKLSFKDTIRLAQQFSLGDFVSRELIRKRLNDGKHVGLHEGFYPAMQGYDSYFMDTDVQIGGTDQTFNMQAGRVLQKNWRNKESFVLATEFLMGTDGRKMSKTWNNAIWLDDNPNDMYAKIMAINDNLIIQYFTLVTDMPTDEIKNIERKIQEGTNPIEFKKILAFEIVKQLNDEGSAKTAQEHFEKTIQKREIPKDIPVYQYTGNKINIDDLLVKAGLAGSKSDARRLIEQCGVSLDGRVIKDPNEKIEKGVLKVGKHRFAKIRTS